MTSSLIMRRSSPVVGRLFSEAAVQPVEQRIGVSAGVARFGAPAEKQGEGLGLVLAFGVQRIPAMVRRPGADTEEVAVEERRRQPGEGHRLLRFREPGLCVVTRHDRKGRVAEELVAQLVGVGVDRLSADRLGSHPDVVRVLRGPPEAARALETRRKRIAVQYQGPVMVIDGGLVERLDRQRIRDREAVDCFDTASTG
ncbi:hypothetical protein ACH4ZX_12735 [Streptomyces sp. NPDC020490]|uniref:hypothetical protein n=1 Tax=Streptomyces sp. NPDC020490 TaxID=3365078 RepID=UPI0037A5400E